MIHKNPNIKDVILMAKQKNRKVNSKIILKAYQYAKMKHGNQLRKSGEPYIIHPLNVAYIVAQMGLDSSTICAALLHDVVEDTDAVHNDIEEKFSPEIAELVEGVTKIPDTFDSIEERQAENYKKLFTAMEKDIRVILLKIADRLHNVRTLKYLNREKQKYIAKETIDIYAPIANKLGMFDMKNNMENEAFKYLNPHEYRILYYKIKEIESKKISLLIKSRERIKELCMKHRIKVNVSIEEKPIYSLYKKMQNRKKELEEINDLFAMKIIVDSKTDCYIAMGILMEYYQFIPLTFKDYISIPRENMYQALQSILIGEEGIIFKVKICNQIMNEISKNGILAYLKSYEKDEQIFIEDKLKGIKNSLELEKSLKLGNNHNHKTFLQVLKTELFEEEVYVFTSKGELVILPKGATIIDFAYKLSEEIGNNMISCEVNSKKVPITTELIDGDIVNITTSKEDKENKQKTFANSYYIDFNSLNIVKTAKAKNCILKNLYTKINRTNKEKIEKSKEPIIMKNKDNVEMMKENKEKFFKKKNIAFQFYMQDKEGLALDMAQKMKQYNLNILSFNTNFISKEYVKIDMEVEIDNFNQSDLLEKLKTALGEKNNSFNIIEE